jgi:hypothetical protein
VRAVTAVLPLGVPVIAEDEEGPVVALRVGPNHLGAVWIGEGWLGDVTDLLDRKLPGVDLVVARHMSPGAAAGLAQAGLGWVDETGGAELVLPGLILARSGRNPRPVKSEPRWTSAVLGTTEALLTGVRPTVSAVHERTGLSTGAATKALATLTELGHLRASSARGRKSAREIHDKRRLLQAYATAALAQRPRPYVRVGVVGDLLTELGSLGKQWDALNVKWSLTGVAGAALIAPYLAQVTSADVLVDASTPAELEALARRSGLQVLDGGRVTLRQFPSAVSDRLSTVVDDMRVAPWPRVFADLRLTGVRGEEAAEHLWEAMTHG